MNIGHSKIRTVNLPFFGRLRFVRDRFDANVWFPDFHPVGHLAIKHFRRGVQIDERDLGYGLVTNVGVLALANDALWPVTNAPNNLIRALKYHCSGTSATAAAVTDIKLNTASGFGGQTPVAGTQLLVAAASFATMPIYRSVATINYTGTENVQEWGFMAYNSVLPATTVLTDASASPFTAGSATTGTVTTAVTASGATTMGQCCSVADNTNATRVSWGLVTSNTTTVLTVPAWYLTATGLAGTAPVNADTMVFRPVMWDHKQFAAIGVNSGDSIQFTYSH